jgi:hypothetical protein
MTDSKEIEASQALAGLCANPAEQRIVYLSGPMKGYPERNYPLFRDVTAKLRASGHRVYDPSEFPHTDISQPFPIRAAFAAYSSFICLEADTLILLPGWEKSKGASAERALADNCGIEIIEWGTPAPAVDPIDRDLLTKVLTAELVETYSCTRDWSAWGYGTMTQDDFEPAEARAAEIADSIIRALSAA